MTGEHERYPPPSFSAAAEPPAASHWSRAALQNSRKFEASRDWSWTQPKHTGPWTGHYPPQQYPAHQGNTAAFSRGRPPPPPHPPGRWGSAQHHWGRRKQQKEPEFSLFCDTCDRGFKTQDKYDEHVSQHVKCSVEDCRFTAHEKLVKIHWRNNHAPGAKRIKLDTAEDISRWREERRRNYPTLKNIEKKLKLMEVKQQRGDVLETAQFGRIRSGGRGCGSDLWRAKGSRHTSSETDLKRTHQDSDPLAALVCSDPESDKDESLQQTQTRLTVAPKSMTSALGSLMSSYGDDMTSSESEGDTNDAPVLRVTQALEENKKLLDAAPLPVQRIPAALHAQKHTPQQSQHAPAARGRGRGARGGRGEKTRKPAETQRRRATLLEMLLAPDIRHERNVLLQCVRFIIRSGFFGLSAKDSGEISVCVKSNEEDLQTDRTRFERETSAGENARVKESPQCPSVFQQLFAEQLVCDESEETLS